MTISRSWNRECVKCGYRWNHRDSIKCPQCETRSTQITDHLGRTDKDFAIEFGIYLATAAEHYITIMRDENANGDIDCEARQALISAIYEFRKRVTRIKKN